MFLNRIVSDFSRRITILAVILTVLMFIFFFVPSMLSEAQTIFNCGGVAQIPLMECQALATFYNSTNGNNWTDNTGWGNSTPCSSWIGVGCQGGHVVSLFLPSNNLTGILPAQINNLTELGLLDLRDNQLTGTIPDISSLNNLQYLILYANQLTGGIPDLGSQDSLIELNLSANQLTGGIPWDDLSGNIDLSVLDLGANNLNGSINDDVGTLTGLTVLSLGGNNMNGVVPWDELSSLIALETLNLGGNDFTGSIGTEIGALTALETLELSGNQFSGPLPSQLGNLDNLTFFSAFGNQLNGTIPPEIGTMNSLKYLQLGSNALTGSIPPQLKRFFGVPDTLTFIGLANNQLTGSIPPELGAIMPLQQLHLSGNRLTGSIPPQLGNLPNLNFLWLNGNQFEGSIPESFLNLTNLAPGGLRLEYNMLRASSPALLNFLNTHNTLWDTTQTIPPVEIGIEAMTADSATIIWTPIPYTGDRGHYEVGYSTTPGGPYTVAGQTANKNDSTYIVTGLNLATRHYFAVRTFTPAHVNNKNNLTSEFSADATNAVPVAVDDAYTTAYNASLTIDSPGILSNDSDADGDAITAVFVTGAGNGSLTLSPNGSFIYTPQPLFTGTDSFTYQATDGIGVSNTAVVSIVVNEPTGSGRVDNEIVIEDTVGTVLPTFTFTLPVDENGVLLPVEWINLVIRDLDGNTILDYWFPYDRHCVGILCSFTLTADLLPGGLLNGSYIWLVRTWSAETGTTDFNDGQPFDVEFVPPAIPANVRADVGVQGVVTSWDYDPAAAWYRIAVLDSDGKVVFDEWMRVEDLDCDETRCTFILPNDPDSGALVNGDYILYIQAWGPGGFNNGSDEEASEAYHFSVNLEQTGPVGLPEGTNEDWAVTNTRTGSPTFRWTPAPNATWHLLWIGNVEQLITSHSAWYPVSAMDCPEGVTNPCTITPQNIFLTVQDFEYDAWLLPWGPGNGDNPQGEFGEWFEFTHFTVEVDPPGQAIPMTPTGTIHTGTPVFQWDHVPDVSWYNVWIGTYDAATNVYTQYHYQWHRATEIGCLATGVCTIDPPGLYLPQGDNYYWWILTYNPAYDPNNPNWSEPGHFVVARP